MTSRAIPDAPTALESMGTGEQAIRIAAVLSDCGYRPDVVCDAFGDPVVVRIPEVFTAEEVAAIVASPLLNASDPLRRINNFEVGDVLPYGNRSGQVYPRTVCDMLDAVVCAITGRDDVVAKRLSTPEGSLSAGVGDAGPHTDFPGDVSNPEMSEVHGFNVHVTLLGEGVAQFSLVRSFDEVRRIADRIETEERGGKTAIEINEDVFPELFDRFMAWASAPVHHTVGDVLLFQARPHESKGLLPTVHHFRSLAEERLNNVFVPKAGDRTTVLARRSEMIGRYRLGHLGYPIDS